jgi:hypothetical protein
MKTPNQRGIEYGAFGHLSLTRFAFIGASIAVEAAVPPTVTPVASMARPYNAEGSHAADNRITCG